VKKASTRRDYDTVSLSLRPIVLQPGIDIGSQSQALSGPPATAARGDCSTCASCSFFSSVLKDEGNATGAVVGLRATTSTRPW